METALSLFPVIFLTSPSLLSVTRRGCSVLKHRWWSQELWLCLCTSVSLCKPELNPTATRDMRGSPAEKIKAVFGKALAPPKLLGSLPLPWSRPVAFYTLKEVGLVGGGAYGDMAQNYRYIISL